MKNKKHVWKVRGLIYGFVLFIGLHLVYPLIIGEDISTENLFPILILFLVIGLLYGYIEKWIYMYFNKKEHQ